MSTWAWLCVGDRETSKPLNCSEIGDYEKSDLSLAEQGGFQEEAFT